VEALGESGEQLDPEGGGVVAVVGCDCQARAGFVAERARRDLELGEIESGGLALILENEFPLEVEASAEVYDENWQLLEVLVDKEIVAAAPVDGQGRTLTPEASRIARSFEIEELNQVLEEGKHIIFNFVLNTRPGDQEVGIYSDYRVRAKLVGDFTYKLSN